MHLISCIWRKHVSDNQNAKKNQFKYRKTTARPKKNIKTTDMAYFCLNPKYSLVKLAQNRGELFQMFCKSYKLNLIIVDVYEAFFKYAFNHAFKVAVALVRQNDIAALYIVAICSAIKTKFSPCPFLRLEHNNNSLLA